MTALTEKGQLLEIWESFYAHRQSISKLDVTNFSLILDEVADSLLNIYKDCGFPEPVYDRMHRMFLKVEQLCLFSIITSFEQYRLENRNAASVEENTSSTIISPIATTPISSTNVKNEPVSFKDIAKESEIEKPPPRKTSVRKNAKLEKVKQFSEVDQSLGRGKRRKIAKVHFGFTSEDDTEPQEKKSLVGKDSGNELSDVHCKTQSIVASVDDKTTPLKDNGPNQKLPEGLESGADNADEVQECDGSSKLTLNPSVSEPDKTENKSKVKHQADSESKPKRPSIHKSENNKGYLSAEEDETSKPKQERSSSAGERTTFECDNAAPIICSLCKKTMPDGRDLIRHWKYAHCKEYMQAKKNGQSPNMFYCEVCKESFPAARLFKLHYRIHSGARPHSCDTCGKGFRIFKGLVDHLASHTKEKPFACPQCPKFYPNKKLLNKHIRIHNNQITPRICELCGKQYRTALGLKLHYRVHAGIRPHKCDVCGMSFTQSCSLQMHKRLHTGDKRHICDVCGWRFNTNSALITHRRVHTGEKPYKCSVCEFRCASSSCLKDHMIVHSKEKPYFCMAFGCNSYFKRHAHLITHIKKQHQGMKPYWCKLCGARFSMVSELTHHEKVNACDGGRIKQEVTSETDPTTSQPELIIHDQTQSSVTAQVVDREPRIYRKRPAKPRPVQEIQIIQPEVDHSGLALAGDGEIVIHIVTEPGQEGNDVVLTEEEMTAIVRLSQQIQ